jgi:hypothetical protein
MLGLGGLLRVRKHQDRGLRFLLPPFLTLAGGDLRGEKTRPRACFQTSQSDLDPPKSPLKRGTLSRFSPLFKAGLIHSPETRQGLKSLAYNPSRLKTTQILIYSPVSEDLIL